MALYNGTEIIHSLVCLNSFVSSAYCEDAKLSNVAIIKDSNNDAPLPTRKVRWVSAFSEASMAALFIAVATARSGDGLINPEFCLA